MKYDVYAKYEKSHKIDVLECSSLFERALSTARRVLTTGSRRANKMRSEITMRVRETPI